MDMRQAEGKAEQVAKADEGDNFERKQCIVELSRKASSSSPPNHHLPDLPLSLLSRSSRALNRSSLAFNPLRPLPNPGAASDSGKSSSCALLRPLTSLSLSAMLSFSFTSSLNDSSSSSATAHPLKPLVNASTNSCLTRSRVSFISFLRGLEFRRSIGKCCCGWAAYPRMTGELLTHSATFSTESIRARWAADRPRRSFSLSSCSWYARSWRTGERAISRRLEALRTSGSRVRGRPRPRSRSSRASEYVAGVLSVAGTPDNPAWVKVAVA